MTLSASKLIEVKILSEAENVIFNSNNEVVFSDVEIIGDEKELIWITGLAENITLITIGQEFVLEGQKVNFTLEALN